MNVSPSRRLTAAAALYALLFQLLVSVRMAPPLFAQPAPVPPLSAPHVAAASGIVLTPVTTAFDGITGVAHYAPSNELAVATSGQAHDLELVGDTGGHRPFSSLAGVLNGARLAVAENGTTYAPSKTAGAIVRVSADGATVQTAWVTLPGEIITALTVDGGDVIAVTRAGNVYRINATGPATRIATTGTALGAVMTVAADPDRFGPWAGKIVAAAETQPVALAIDAAGAVTTTQLPVVARDLAVIPAHENFFGIDTGDNKVWGAPAAAFTGMVGDVLLAQAAPGVLAKLHWNGTAFESAEIARVAQWQQLAFSPAGVAEIPTARRPYDKIAVVRHAPAMSSGRIEGALWQLAPEPVTLDGQDVITSDLLVPGTPAVTASTNGSFGGTIEGTGSATPSGYAVSIGGSATLGHLLTRTDPMTLDAVAAAPATANTRDVSLTSEGESAGDFATIRDLSISGKAGVVAVPPGTYGRLSASGRTTFALGVAGATEPAVYNVRSLTLTGGSELRVDGPVVLTSNEAVTLTGSTLGASDAPRRLTLRIASGELHVGGNAVLYAIVRAPQSLVTIEGQGRVRGTVACDRLAISGVLQLTDADLPPPPVNRPPAVDAGPDASTRLPADTVQLNGAVSDDGLPAGAALTITWTTVSGPGAATFGDAHAAKTTARFAAAGTYVLRLTADDSLLRSTDDVTVTVAAANVAPVVNAGADQSLELPSVATLTGAVTDVDPTTVTWSAPAGVTFSNANALTTTATFAARGVYTLRLTASDGELTAFDEVVITVAPANVAPVVNAGPDQSIRLPQTATLTGTVTDVDPTTVTWTGAGVTFSNPNALTTTATFSAPGTYTLRLTATDGRLTSFDEVTVTVTAANVAPVVNAGPDQSIELPSIATLTGSVTDVDPTTVTWSGPAGVTFANASALTTTATFAAPGVYTLKLIATDGELTGSDEVIITVAPQNVAPVVDAGADQSIRLPNTATLTGTVTDVDPTTVTWSGPAGVTFSNANALTTTATFAAAGTYTLTLTASDGRLSGTDQVTITVAAANVAPVVNAGADQAIELPSVAALSGTVTDVDPTTVTWSGPAGVTFANANALTTTATFAAPGVYTLKLTASDGELTGSDEVIVTVAPQNVAPVVDAGADQSIRLPNTATLTGTVTDTDPTTVTWSGPAGVTFANANALTTTATFAAAGTYTLTLTASDGRLSGSDQVTITVAAANVAPVVNAGADQAIELPSVAALSGTVNDVDPTTVTWSGPAGVTFANANALTTTATFAAPGVYTLKLTATDGELTGSDEVIVTVAPQNIAPVVDAGADQSIRLPNTATLNGTVSDTDATTVTWSGPAGVTFANANALTTTATFAAAGTYTLTLTASDGRLSGSDQVTITVAAANVAPVVNAGADQAIELPSVAALSGTVTDVDPTTVTWSGPAGVTFSNANALTTTATFAAPGVYTLKLTATDGELTGSDEVVVTVAPQNIAPVVDAGADQSIRLPNTATLTGTVTDADATTVTWSGPAGVTFGNANALTTTATFAAAGTYTLTLTASDGRLSGSDQVTITVAEANVAPVVNAGVDQTIELPSVAALTGTVTDVDATTVTWSGPAGVTFSNTNALTTNATFAAPGVYTLKLTATDGELTGSDEVIVTVKPENVAPVVDAGADQSIRLPNTATLTGVVTDTDATTVTWSGPAGVTFGNANALTTTATFAAAGTYTLTLTATDGRLTGSDQVTITVARANVAPVVNAGADQTVALPNTAALTGTVTDTDPTTVTWSGPAGVTFANANALTTTATFAAAGTYTLTLTASDGEFTASDDIVVTVVANKAPIVDAGADQTLSFGAPVHLTSTVTDDGLPTGAAVTLTWTKVSGPSTVTFSTPGQATTDVVFGDAGVYVLRLTASDSQLTASDDVTITLRRAPVAGFTVAGPMRSLTRWDNSIAGKWRGGTVVSATPSLSGTPDLVLDDDIYSGWRASMPNAFMIVKLAGTNGAPRLVDRVRLLNPVNSEAVKTFRIDVSATGTGESDFTTVLTDLAINSNRFQEYRFAPVAARYVRFTALTSYTTSTMQLQSLEVIAAGVAGIESYSGAANLASTDEQINSYGSGTLYWAWPYWAFDGDLTTAWLANKSSSPVYVLAQLGEYSAFDRIRIRNLDDGQGRAVRDFRVEVSDSNAANSYTTVYQGTAQNDGTWQEFTFPQTRAAWVRFVVLSNWGHATEEGIRELQVVPVGGGQRSVSTYVGPANRPELLLDDNVQTEWVTPTGRVAGEYVILRLSDGDPGAVEKIVLQSGGTDQSPKDFDLYASTTTTDDAAFTKVLSATMIADRLAPVQFFTIPGGPIRARYLKLVIRSDWGSPYGIRLSTFQALAPNAEGNIISAPTPQPAVRNLSPSVPANGATVVAASSGLPANMLDYVHSSTWLTSSKTNQYAVIKLAGNDSWTLTGVRLATDMSSTSVSGSFVKDFEVWVSNTTADDAAFTKILTATTAPITTHQRFVFPAPVAAKYVKFVPLTTVAPTASQFSIGYFDVQTTPEAGGVIESSGNWAMYMAEYAFDGIYNPPWYAGQGSVTNAWVKVAMPGAQSRKIYGVWMGAANYPPKDFEIRLSNTTADDAAFTTVYSGTFVPGQINYLFDKAYDAKYILFFFKNAATTSYLAIDEMGPLAIPADGAAVTAISSYTNGQVFTPSMVIDANPKNIQWTMPGGQTTNQSLTVALPNAGSYTVDRVGLQAYPCCYDQAPRDFDVQIANDPEGAAYTTVLSATLRADGQLQHFFFPPVQARYIRLLLRNNYGSTVMQVQKFWVFSPEVGSLQARFSDTTQRGDSDIAQYVWTFGDGGTSTQRDPQHDYAAPGTYDVRLTVTDGNGVASTFTRKYTALGGPAIGFTITPDPADEASSIAVADTSTSNFGSIITSDWAWGDGQFTQNRVNDGHRYEDNGVYPLTHTVVNARGITASLTKNLTVRNVPPSVSAGPDLTVPWNADWAVKPIFNDVSSIDRVSLLCHWDFGDGQTLDQPNCYGNGLPKHSYATTGVYTATFTVTDKDGGVGTDTTQVTVTRRPTHVSYGGQRGITPNSQVHLHATLRDDLALTPMAGFPVSFTVGAQIFTLTTDAAGAADGTVAYTGADPVTSIAVNFAGDAKYFPSSTTAQASCPAQQQPIDVAFVFDLSESMGGIPYGATGIMNLVDVLEPWQDRASVVVFRSNAQMEQQLTNDWEAIRATFAHFNAFDGSSMHLGIQLAQQELTGVRANPNANRVMVIFSDGGVSDTEAKAAANAAKAAGIRIITICTRLNIPLMQTLASSPGDAYATTTFTELPAIFGSLIATICPGANKAPLVNAGPDKTISTSNTTVEGSVTDDGLPVNGSLSTTWSLVSGPGLVRIYEPAKLTTKVSFEKMGTYVLRLTANDSQYVTTDDISITIDTPIVNAAPFADAGADQLAALPQSPSVPPVTLHKIASVYAPVGIDDHLPSNKIVMSVNYPGGNPSNLALISADGKMTAFSDLRNLTDELKIATVKDDGGGRGMGGFVTGEVFTGTGQPGQIVRVSPDGSTVRKPWVTLPGETGLLRGSLYVDRTGVFGGDLIAVTTTGGVWRINEAGVPTLIKRLPTHLEGVVTVPNDPAKYGPWAGKILIGAEQEGNTYAVDVNGNATAYRLDIWPEDIDIIVPHQNWFGIDYDGNAVWAVDAAAFANWIGDFIFVQESGYMYHVWWNGSAFQKTLLAQVQHFEHTTFSGAGLGDIAPVGVPVTLNGRIDDDGLPITGTLTSSWSMVSGPARVAFETPNAPVTVARFVERGTYVLRLTATDGALSTSDDVTVTVNDGNKPPAVNAGADQSIRLPNTATLTGQVTDDSATLTYAWSQVSGPASVTFSSASAISTTATFTAPGNYILRLTVSDGEFTSADDVVVTVAPPPVNQAPVVNAGADVTFADPATSATLTGTVTDDNLPTGATVTYAWSLVSGPGTATFSAPSALTTTVTFTKHGVYVVRLTANDTALSASDDVVVTWDGANTAPVVNGGADITINLSGSATLAGSVTDDGLPVTGTLTTTWTSVSGPGAVTFATPNAATTTATFSATGTYVVRLTANDGAASSSDNVTVTVNADVPPPTAELTYPAPGATITDRTTIRGTISDGATWRVEYRLNSASSATDPSGWTTIATGSGPVTDGPLGTIDPTLLLNGTYKVRLVATNGSGDTATSISVVLDGDLKVGFFSLSFVDLNVPLSGVPITLTRTYDSRDTRVGDFGHGWHLSISDIRVEESSVLGQGWNETVSGVPPFLQYCLQPSTPKFVTITLPGGKVYRFSVSPSPQCQQIAPIQTTPLVFVPVGNTHGSLTADAETDLIVDGSIPGAVNLVDSNVQPFNPSVYHLTLEDGTVLTIDETLGLREIHERNGNTVTFGATSIVHSSGRSTGISRDTLNRITTITGPDGKALHYTYDANGDLAGVTDPTSRTTTFIYDTTHRMLEMRDPLGRRAAKTEYDASGRVIALTDESGNTVRHAYDATGRVETITDRRGKVSVHTYDERGNVLSIVDADGSVTKATYDANNQILTRTDALNRTTKYAYDANGNVSRLEEADGRVSTYIYNAYGQLTSATDPAGKTWAQTYDAYGNLETTTDPLGHTNTFTYDAHGNRLTETDAEGRVVRYTYDAFGNRITEADAASHAKTYAYDVMGRKTSEKDENGNETKLAYDDAGRVLTKTSPSGDVERNEYDGAGGLAAIVDANGGRTELTATGSGVVTGMKSADGTDASFAYNENQQFNGTSRAGWTTSYERDDVGHRTSLTTAGATYRYKVDALGRRTELTDPLDHVTKYTYNSLDKLETVTDGAGSKTSYTYDANGRRKTITDANNHTTTYVYDDAGRMTKLLRPDGAGLEFGYDKSDLVTSTRDAAGHLTTFGYDTAGALSAVTLATGDAVGVTHDDRGLMTAVTDANQHTFRYAYDEDQRLTGRTYADGKSETITYAHEHEVATSTDRAGRKTTYTRDTAGRVTRIDRPDGTFVTYTYTPAGKVDLVTDARGTTDYDYDVIGHVTHVKFPDGNDVSYTYDGVGNRKSVVTPDGTTAYAYDGANRLSAVTDPHGHVTRYVYDAAGNNTEVDYPNGLVTLRTFNALNRITSVQTKSAAGTTVFGETYEYDANGNQSKATSTDGSSVTYDYDAISRLTGETDRAADGSVTRTIAYAYDGAGNRTTVNDSQAAASRTATFNAVDELLADGSTSYTYDANGNRGAVTIAGHTTTYTYDVQNHLTAATYEGQSTSTYLYDANGNRVQAVSAAGATTNYVYDVASPVPAVLTEEDAAHEPAATFTYGAQLISETRGTQEYFYVYDALGSVRELVDENGNVVAKYAYDAFGNVTSRQGNVPNPYLYRAMRFDEETGLYVLPSRAYDAVTGRFLTMDTVQGDPRDPLTRNRYIYALDNPVNRVDPRGNISMIGGIGAHVLIEGWYLSYMGVWPYAGFALADIPIPEGPGGAGQSKKSGGLGSRPDLREYGFGEIFEIKPLSNYGIGRVMKEAIDYARALNISEPGAPILTGVWYPGVFTFYDPPFEELNLEVHGPLSFALPGSVIYAEDWFEELKKLRPKHFKTVAEAAVLTVAVPAAVPAAVTAGQTCVAGVQWVIQFAQTAIANEGRLIVGQILNRLQVALLGT